MDDKADDPFAAAPRLQPGTGACSRSSVAPSPGGVTRRQFAHLSALGAAMAANMGAASAQAERQVPIGKASKQVAGYIEKAENSAQTCVQCHFFIDPDDCIIVQGPVSPWGYCNYFAD